jgi:molybdopterin converting factor small subunit
MKIYIQVKLYATLRKFTPDAGLDRFELDTGATVENLLDKLDIPPAEAKLVFVNGKKADRTAALNNGERVGIFPPVGGG